MINFQIIKISLLFKQIKDKLLTIANLSLSLSVCLSLSIFFFCFLCFLSIFFTRLFLCSCLFVLPFPPRFLFFFAYCWSSATSPVMCYTKIPLMVSLSFSLSIYKNFTTKRVKIFDLRSNRFQVWIGSTRSDFNRSHKMKLFIILSVVRAEFNLDRSGYESFISICWSVSRWA